MKKRLLSMLLVFVMLLSILPVGALAAEPDYNGYSFVFERQTFSGYARIYTTITPCLYEISVNQNTQPDVSSTFYLERCQAGGYYIYAKPDGNTRYYLKEARSSDSGKLDDFKLVTDGQKTVFYVEKKTMGALS